jgi:hypothetical protein
MSCLKGQQQQLLAQLHADHGIVQQQRLQWMPRISIHSRCVAVHHGCVCVHMPHTIVVPAHDLFCHLVTHAHQLSWLLFRVEKQFCMLVQGKQLAVDTAPCSDALLHRRRQPTVRFRLVGKQIGQATSILGTEALCRLEIHLLLIPSAALRTTVAVMISLPLSLSRGACNATVCHRVILVVCYRNGQVYDSDTSIRLLIPEPFACVPTMCVDLLQARGQ